MTPEEPDDVAALWRAQTPESTHPNSEEMRRVLERMERKMRRNTMDFVIAAVLVSATIVWLAVAFRHPLLTAGAIVSLAGGSFLTFEVLQHRRRAPVAEDGAAASIEYHRALLQHQLEFHRTRVWLRVLMLAPGGVLFFLGFAAARPDLAALIYVELATFFLGVALIIPANRRAAAKLERQIASLTPPAL
jgi:hypothetical protein